MISTLSRLKDAMALDHKGGPKAKRTSPTSSGSTREPLGDSAQSPTSSPAESGTPGPHAQLFG